MNLPRNRDDLSPDDPSHSLDFTDRTRFCVTEHKHSGFVQYSSGNLQEQTSHFDDSAWQLFAMMLFPRSILPGYVLTRVTRKRRATDRG